MRQTTPSVVGQQSLTTCAMAPRSSPCSSVVPGVMSAVREYSGAPYSLMTCVCVRVRSVCVSVLRCVSVCQVCVQVQVQVRRANTTAVRTTRNGVQPRARRQAMRDNADTDRPRLHAPRRPPHTPPTPTPTPTHAHTCSM
jgi:ferredoxin